MRKHRYIYYFLFFFVLIWIQNLSAQDAKKGGQNIPAGTQDTVKKKVIYEKSQLKAGSPEYIDSMKRARQNYVDSLKTARAAELDSMKRVQQRISDSTMAANKRYSDSIKSVLDAQRAARLKSTDSLKALQKQRSDSLARAKAYKESKGYKDSVARVKQARLDSLTAVRKQRNEQMALERQKIQDSMLAVRKQYNDSLKAIVDAQKARNKVMKDSLAVVRAARTDSLAKAKVEREAASKKRSKDRDKKATARERDKEQKKRNAYSNEKMRKKKWSFMRQAYQNTTTRYNYFYNANLKIEQTIKNMLATNANNYDSLLPLYPFDPDKDSARMASDMDSLIRRAGVGIQIHDPRSKWQDNLYMIVGQAYYYKGDYTNAANAFKYIVATAEAEKKQKEKEKQNKSGKKAEKVVNDLAEAEKKNIFTHLSSKNDAMLWLARTLAQDSQVNLAQTVLNMVKSSKNYNKDLEGRFAAAQAFVDIKKNAYSEATDDLAVLYEDQKMPKWLRERAAYLRGQVLQRENKLAASDSAFAKVIDLKPDMEMDFYARIHIVNNSIETGTGDATKLMATLDQMAKEAKYKAFYDKIYFTKAKVAERNNDAALAITNYKKSISVNSGNVVQRGLSFAAMGSLYYGKNDYNEAKKAYDSAIAFLTIANNPVYSIAVQRASALDKVSIPGNDAKYLDSVLTLAGLSEKDQRAVAKKYIKDLERRISDSTYNAQNPGNNSPVLAAPVTLGSGGGSWYFANAATVQQGVNSFKQKWGERTLKDGWNRSSTYSAGSSSAGNIEEPEADNDPLKNLPTEEELLAQIPKGEKDINALKEKLQQALFDLGTAYYKNMEDIPMALKTYDTLDQRFPEHPNRAEELYYRYLMALSKSEVKQADGYAQELKSKHGASKWATLISTDAAQLNENASTETIEAHYETTYQTLMQQQYQEAKKRADGAQALYPNVYEKFARKYNLISIASIAGMGDYTMADSLLTGFIAQNPNDETIGWAGALQKYVKEAIKSAAANPATANSAAAGPQVLPGVDAPKEYTYSPAGLHYVLISTPVADSRLSGLRAGLKDYNQSKRNNKELAISLVPVNEQRSALVVKEFKNAAAAKAYIAEIMKVNALFREYPDAKEYEIISISSYNIIKLFTDKDWAAYLSFYKTKY
ncbi:hypothetical protein DBR32_06440 [Taibaiella sp. KBW10]|uniref:type IX secretion system periplasmic lipoprotein PorW/SprE n=1 Tax=Taibaiella sp. KBW10 TaxID=2153357 RepID=UPI000F5935FA|nr:tetratricopeptide repeat protein [Taibaiella sp. KBW10]RQO31591.1 hypothetical protein DBR32_06440 [Taibaiella sp. KBW10]